MSSKHLLLVWIKLLLISNENVDSNKLPSDGLEALKKLASVDTALSTGTPLTAETMELHCLSWTNVSDGDKGECFKGWSSDDPLCLETTTAIDSTAAITTAEVGMVTTITVTTMPQFPTDPLERLKALSDLDVKMIKDPTLKADATLLGIHCLNWRNMNETDGGQCFSGWFMGDPLCPGSTTAEITNEVGRKRG